MGRAREKYEKVRKSEGGVKERERGGVRKSEGEGEGRGSKSKQERATTKGTGQFHEITYVTF
jgi:hypothetical protein